MDVGLLAAFVGGTLALISPCSALVLPAFFASTAGTGRGVAIHGAVFFAGLVAVLVPLGMGAGAVGGVFTSHRSGIIAAAAVVMVLMGVAQMFGFGFDPARALPDRADPRVRAAEATGWVRTGLLGAASGVAGFCAGPILGSILTMAAARGDSLSAGVLLACYGAGMVVPLVVVAAWWQRSDRPRRGLRGREFEVLGRRFHSTSVFTGAVIVVVGWAFWATNGFLSAPEFVSLDTQAWLQARVGALADPVVDVAVVVGGAAVVLGVWWWRRSRTGRVASTAEPGPSRSGVGSEPSRG